MDFVHCNECGHNPTWCGTEDQRNYFLTSCGHVFCQRCSIGIQETCPVCKVKCRLVQVSSESKAEIKAYFTDPAELLKESLKQFVQVAGFQKTQLKSFKIQSGKLLERQKALRAENDQLRGENVELHKRIENLELREQSWIGNGILHSSPRNSTPGGFMQQNLDPTFTSIFESGRVRGGPFGNITSTPHGSTESVRMVTPPVTSDSRSTTGNANNRVGLGHGGRTSIPYTPATPASRENLPRYSPVVTPKGVSTLRTTPNSGRSIVPGQQQQGCSTTPDIMQRLKNLRW